jgi:hypothetical protein
MRRVVLEELAQVSAVLQTENRARRDHGETPEERAETVARWAQEHDLLSDDRHVRFPDARIGKGPRWPTRVENIEVVTPHYRGAHAAAKARSIHVIGLWSALEVSGQPEKRPGVDPRPPRLLSTFAGGEPSPRRIHGPQAGSWLPSCCTPGLHRRQCAYARSSVVRVFAAPW